MVVREKIGESGEAERSGGPAAEAYEDRALPRANIKYRQVKRAIAASIAIPPGTRASLAPLATSWQELGPITPTVPAIATYTDFGFIIGTILVSSAFALSGRIPLLAARLEQPLENHQGLDGPRQVLQDEVPVSPDEVVQMTKDLCNYIHTTYGRFPAQLDAMNMCMWLQAHHLETDYYDRFMQPGAYHQAIAHHMQVWHGG